MGRMDMLPEKHQAQPQQSHRDGAVDVVADIQRTLQ
jgi:hypothetical protein